MDNYPTIKMMILSHVFYSPFKLLMLSEQLVTYTSGIAFVAKSKSWDGKTLTFSFVLGGNLQPETRIGVMLLA